jgi:cytochrome P450
MQSEIEMRFEQVMKGAPMDLAAFYRDAREHAPIFWSEAFNGWVVSRYSDTKRVLFDEECFGPLTIGAGSSIIHGRSILQMEGDEHRRKGAILAKTLRNTRLLETTQRDFTRTLSAQLFAAFPNTGDFDLKEGFTTKLPLGVTSWVMDIAEAPNFRSNYDAIVAGGASNLRGDASVQARAQQARTELFAFITPLIEYRRKNPGDDLLSTLCSAEFEGDTLSDDEIRSFCSFLLAAGVETTDRSLSSLMKHLISHPHIWHQLKQDRSLVLPAIVESLRWAPPVHAVSRGARIDTEIAGQLVKKGERIVTMMASGNRDPEVFENPDEFVVDRFKDTASKEFSSKATILSFGYGLHLCTGSLLAKMEMVEGLEVLLDNVEEFEFSRGVPDDVGYVLRSPAHLMVNMKLSKAKPELKSE